MHFSPYDHLIPPFATFASGLTLHDAGWSDTPGGGREVYARMIVGREFTESLGLQLIDLNTLSPDVTGMAAVISCESIGDDACALLMRLSGPISWENAIPPYPRKSE